MRRHSCGKHLAIRDAARRALAREAATDRTPKPCLHPIARHEHGTHACYVLDCCRCVTCAAANSNYEQARHRDRAYGKTAYVDAAPAVEHVRALTAAGLGWKAVARRAGVAENVVGAMLYGRADRSGGAPQRRARESTVAAILAVPMPTLDDLAGGVRVPAIGSARRVRALIACGWSARALAARSGIDRQILDGLASGSRDCAVASTARQIRDLYEELWDVPAPDGAGKTRALRRAAAAGWAPPAAWDDEALDDPTAAEPEPSTATRSASLDLDEWLHLVTAGEDPVRAAERLGVTISTVDRAAYRAGRTDVLACSSGARSAARRAS